MKIKSQIILSLLFLLVSFNCSSQNEIKIVKGKFITIPKFNAGCGFVISAEKISLNLAFDTINCYLICSEIYKNSLVDLNGAYIFETYEVDFDELTFQIYGIKDENVKICILNSFKLEE